MFFLKKLFKNNQDNNFDIVFDKIRQIEKTKSDYDLVIFNLDKLLSKEKELFDKSKKTLRDKQIFEKREKSILKYKEQILFKINKEKRNNIILEIKESINNSNIEEIEKKINILKNEYIDKYKNLFFLDVLYKKFLKRLNNLKKILDTSNVNNFNQVIIKIKDFISLKKLDLASKAIDEIKNKEYLEFNKYKENHFVSRRKVKKYEKEYNKRINKLDEIIKKIFILRNKEIEKQKILEKQKLFFETKNNLKELIEKDRLLDAKNFIEKIQQQKDLDVNIFSYLNKKIKYINNKLNNNKEKYKYKDKIIEVKELLKQCGEKNNLDFKDIDKNTKEIIFLKIKEYIKKISSFLFLRFNSYFLNKTLKELDIILSKGGINLKDEKVLKDYHIGINKNLGGVKMFGYDFYGQIISPEKITGDTFVFNEKKDKYWFSLGDATGHGLSAGLIVSKFTKFFNDNIKNYDKIDYFRLDINNKLKTDLSSGKFITSIFFEINKNFPDKVNMIGFGHEPLYIYREKTNTIEELRLFGLAGGIRKIEDIKSIKIKTTSLEDGDIICSFTDGIIEEKNSFGKRYGINRFKEKLLIGIQKEGGNLKNICNYLISDLIDFTGGKKFYDDDITIILFGRNKKTDLILNESNIELITKNLDNIKINNPQRYKGKSKEEVLKELEDKRLKKELEIVIEKLYDLYKDGEIIKLKEEALSFIKKGYVSSKINKYLKKSLIMEEDYKLNLKNQKLQVKYDTLLRLYKKGDYKNVIKESYDVIVKNGNI